MHDRTNPTPAPADARDGTLSRRRVLGLGTGMMVAMGSGALGALLAGCSGGEEATAPAPPDAGTSGAGSAPPEDAKAPSSASGAATADAGTAADAGDAKLITEIPANEPLVASLQYVHESQKPDQRCSNCFFYSAKTDARGSCQLFQRGLVEAGGWCSSWQAKPA